MNIDGDSLELLSGPEDGTVYPLLEDVIDVGSSDTAAVQLRLDALVESNHVRLFGNAEGYIVRCLDGGGVLVNGKSVSRFRSRLLKGGDILQVGDSELVFHSAAEGHTRRGGTSGVMDSDFAWAARQAGKSCAGVGLKILRIFRPFLRLRYLIPIVVIAGIIILASSRGGLIHQTVLIAQWIRYYIQVVFSWF